LLSRARGDDNKLDIVARLAWFKTNVEPTIDYFKNNLYYTVLEVVNGEQSIEAVNQEILHKTGNSNDKPSKPKKTQNRSRRC